jgi:hypothetical protein
MYQYRIDETSGYNDEFGEYSDHLSFLHDKWYIHRHDLQLRYAPWSRFLIEQQWGGLLYVEDGIEQFHHQSER